MEEEPAIKEEPQIKEDTPQMQPRGPKIHPNDPMHQQIPVPLAGDKNFTMSRAEMRGLTKAMESKEFSDIMNEYIDDISDPKHKAEMEQYL